jgi:polyisoprenoid-binding protein YceI
MAAETWNIDPTHTSIHFSVRHMVIAKVRGSFKRFSGALALDPSNPGTWAVSARIEAASIDTGVEDRDAHLRSPDFFDVEKYPAITFQSTRVQPAAGGRLQVAGQLTIRNVTREVVLDVETLGTGKDPWGNTRAAFAATTSIDRRDFGLTWNQALETGGVLVGERIDIQLEVQAVRAQQAAPQAA